MLAVPGYGYDIGSWMFGPNLFRGLLRFEQGLDAVPDLAEHISVSADGCVYRFLLRQGARWSDGEPLTSDDFAFTYRAIQEQAVGSANLLAGVEAEAVDARTLELRLEEPRPYAPYLFAQLPFFPWPRHHVEALGDGWREPAALVGNGPFIVAEVADDHALLAANPEWHGSRGNVAEVRLDLRAGERDQEWRSGRFDFLMFLGQHPARADAPETVELPISLPGTGYLAFGSQPLLDDERIRRALAHGLDRETIVRGTRLRPAQGA